MMLFESINSMGNHGVAGGYPQNAGILVVLVAVIKQMPGAGLCCLLVFLGLYCLVQSLTSTVGVLASKSASISPGFV